MFKEGLAIRAETTMRKKKLKDAMERKCQEMRENKVPDIYINEVKRMIETVQWIIWSGWEIKIKFKSGIKDDKSRISLISAAVYFTLQMRQSILLLPSF